MGCCGDGWLSQWQPLCCAESSGSQMSTKVKQHGFQLVLNIHYLLAQFLVFVKTLFFFLWFLHPTWGNPPVFIFFFSPVFVFLSSNQFLHYSCVLLVGRGTLSIRTFVGHPVSLSKLSRARFFFSLQQDKPPSALRSLPSSLSTTVRPRTSKCCVPAQGKIFLLLRVLWAWVASPTVREPPSFFFFLWDCVKYRCFKPSTQEPEGSWAFFFRTFCGKVLNLEGGLEFGRG